ncbi:hypothetical protein S7335_3042 [Synechococcus sp. PCC 7335]|uniref:hypothetical protein n=1 Tax=Synechococcus sp. (strain ATCC 29403 / PCC 7335) TaxID=91464 RepID=UPI00017EC42B|nr:hypothetical protein [Synechococcus sp. PCC 7335]EDX85343.1 hypothetical protein S7335_3042 [Synechococcus sp. PCC 7335]
MKYRGIFSLSGLLALGTAFCTLPAIADSDFVMRESLLITQDAEPPENRPPVDSVVATAPIQLRVVNESTIDADISAALLDPPSDDRVAAPGESVTFGRLHTSFLPPPLELEIVAVDRDISLDNLTLAVEDNEIIITILAEPGVSGEARVIRVDEAGLVYIL